MIKNEQVEIIAVGNGFIVRPPFHSDYGRPCDMQTVLAFESRAGLLSYLRKHFDETESPKFAAAKRPL